MFRTGLIAIVLAVACAACGPKASTMQETTPGGQAPTTEVQDVEEEAVEETTLETVEDEDEEMAPPEG